MNALVQNLLNLPLLRQCILDAKFEGSSDIWLNPVFEILKGYWGGSIADRDLNELYGKIRILFRYRTFFNELYAMETIIPKNMYNEKSDQREKAQGELELLEKKHNYLAGYIQKLFNEGKNTEALRRTAELSSLGADIGKIQGSIEVLDSILSLLQEIKDDTQWPVSQENLIGRLVARVADKQVLYCRQEDVSELFNHLIEVLSKGSLSRGCDLRNFFETTLMENGSVQYYFPQVFPFLINDKSKEYLSLPYYLVCESPRGYQSLQTKLFLNLSGGREVMYDLIGIVMYQGSGFSGHYTTYIKNQDERDGQWYYCDDSSIKNISGEIEGILSGFSDSFEPRLLFYAKKSSRNIRIQNLADALYSIVQAA